MAKPLQSGVPTSSVARLLDPASASAATIATPEPATSTIAKGQAATPRPARSKSQPSRLVKRELVLTPQADATFQRLVDTLRQATGCRLTASHAFRAIMRTLEPAAAVIASRPPQRLRLPSNANGFEVEREAFEESVRRVIADAVMSLRDG